MAKILQKHLASKPGSSDKTKGESANIPDGRIEEANEQIDILKANVGKYTSDAAQLSLQRKLLHTKKTSLYGQPKAKPRPKVETKKRPRRP